MPTQGVGTMPDAEVTEFIKNSRVGVLTLVDGDKPYGVPVEHYFDGKNFFIVVSSRDEQRKIDCIKKNPNACFVIYESRREKPEIVKKGIKCRSVIIEGKILMEPVREATFREKPVKLRRLKLEPQTISNWKCPAQKCDWQHAWFEAHPELILP
jgi:nitroimidazol reductase NimA-like FMN-containing flavoprotein (pyridoxamine 5'-phosphate oxidase superfamily)